MDTTRPADGNSPDPTGWTGWVVFASFIMIMLGVFQAIEGLVAIFDDGFYAVTRRAWWSTSTTASGAGST